MNIKTTGASIDQSTDNKIVANITTSLINRIIFKISDYTEVLHGKYINMNAMLNNPVSINALYSISSGRLVCENGNKFQRMALCGGVFNNLSSGVVNTIDAILPIPFSFTKESGLALPVFLVNNKHLSIDIITDSENGGAYDLLIKDPASTNINIILTYYNISDEEKIRFRSSKQQYLVEYVHHISHKLSIKSIDIRSKLPNVSMKYMFLINEPEDSSNIFNGFKYKLDIGGVPFSSDYIPHSLLSKKHIKDFFKGCIYSLNEAGSRTIINSNVAFIPFSLENSVGPSGTLNTINKINLNYTYGDENIPASNDKLIIYIVYYNILEIFNNNFRTLYTYNNNDS